MHRSGSPVRASNLIALARRVLLCALLLVPACSAQATDWTPPEKVIAAIPQHFPPFYFVDSEGRPGGFAVDTLEEIANRAGIKVGYRIEKTWPDVFRALQEGHADLIPNLGISPSRLETYAFTDPINTFPISVFVRSDSDGIRDLGDLTGRHVGTVRANVATKIMEQRRDVEHEVFPSFERALFELLAGHVDAVAYPEPVGRKVAREVNMEGRIKVVGKPLTEIKRGIAVLKANARLATHLNPFVHNVVASPRYTEIFTTWYGTPAPFWTIERVTWVLGSLLFVLTISMAIWRYYSLVAINRDLRRTIGEREQAETALRELNEELEARVERRTAELAVREELARRAREQLSVIFDAAPVPMMLAELDTSAILMANSSAIDTFELTAAGIGEQAAIDLYEDPGQRTKLVAQLRETGQVDDMDLLFRTRSGTLVWGVMSARIIEFEGRPAVLGAFYDITERKQVEEEHRKLSLAVERSPAVVIITDTKGIIEYVNPRFTEVTGFSAQEALGQTPSIMSSGTTPQKSYAEMWQALGAGRIWTGEFENQRKDGSLYWAATSIAPIKNSEGTITHFVSVQEDVTELKAVTDRLRESDQRFHDALEFASIGAWDWNIKTGNLYWTEQIAPLLGYATSELETSYENFVAAIHPDDREAVQDAVRACVEDGADYDIEHRVVWPNGDIRWLQERGDVVRGADGKPVRMLGVVQDITARKESDARLRESEERLASAINNISEGFALFDADDRLLLCNARYRRLYPATVDVIQPGTTFEAIIRAGAERGQYPDAIGREDEWVAERMVHREKRHVSFDQHLAGDRWLRVTDHLLPNGGRVCIRVDITELRDARDQAEAANRAKSEFLSSMSHELRTPLNAILGFAQLLESGQKNPLTERQKGQVQHILKAGQHLLELINEVLDLARIEAGRLDLSIEDVGPRMLLDECLTLARSLAEKRSITVEDHTRDMELPNIRADYLRTKQVLLNLLSNAVKYNRDNGRIGIEAVVTGDQALRLSVSDTGPGIPIEKQLNLFQPFNRLGAETTEIEGTGVGLTITRQLVEHMNGALGFTSSEGQGSVFWIELPLSSGTETDLGTHSAESGETGDVPRLVIEGGTRTLLYVEDNPANIRLMEQILDAVPDLDLITAPSAEAGIDLAINEIPDAIILDMNLPGMDGRQAVKRLKAEPATRKIPVFALSANAMPGSAQLALDAGFRSYLTKPLDIRPFFAALDEAFRQIN